MSGKDPLSTQEVPGEGQEQVFTRLRERETNTRAKKNESWQVMDKVPCKVKTSWVLWLKSGQVSLQDSTIDQISADN